MLPPQVVVPMVTVGRGSPSSAMALSSRLWLSLFAGAGGVGVLFCCWGVCAFCASACFSASLRLVSSSMRVCSSWMTVVHSFFRELSLDVSSVRLWFSSSTASW